MGEFPPSLTFCQKRKTIVKKVEIKHDEDFERQVSPVFS